MAARVDNHQIGGHVRVNIAVDLDQPRPIEFHRLRFSLAVQTEVEAHRGREAEDIVKDPVKIWKVRCDNYYWDPLEDWY